MPKRATGGNWLHAYYEYTKELESPDSYHLWVGLSVIASAVRRNVYIDQGFYHLYPNMFIILVGPSRKMGKSTAIRQGRRLLLSVPEITFGPDSVTRADLIRSMGKISKPGKVTAMTIHSTELSSLIEPSGIEMVQFLTDIYDCEWNPKGWRYSTKHQGKDIIYNPVLNILAGTTPSWISEGLPVHVTEHGFTGRTIFIYEDQLRQMNPRPKEPQKALVEALQEDLNRISNIKGKFYLTPSADKLYQKLYHSIGSTSPADYRLDSFHWSKAKVHLLKVAMLLSLAEDDERELQERDVQLAWDLLSDIEKNMHKTFSAVGKYEYASDMERILNQIVESKKGMTTAEILNKNFAVGDEQTIGTILHTLLKMGKVKRVKRGRQSLYAPANSPAEGEEESTED